jgi:solute carrier family 25 (mitochondrial carrier protein), member 16
MLTVSIGGVQNIGKKEKEKKDKGKEKEKDKDSADGKKEKKSAGIRGIRGFV